MIKMTMYELILKKKRGGALTSEEINWMVREYTNGCIPDYQMSAMLMAVCFQKMNTEETTALTLAMADSGDRMDLSSIKGIKVDKHSTGGVGDKTSLVLAPLVASLGIPVAKMSGRGLGHTGGTIDKLESISGFRTSLSEEEFLKNVADIHIAIAGQTKNLAPADKKLYALRDVTGTVDNLSLIASSIMSKKLASGADAIVLDVKAGDGAFMKTPEEAKALARMMIQIGEKAGKAMTAVISDMNQPLGNAVGNALELEEVIATLKGHGPEDLTELVFTLGACMLLSAKAADSMEDAEKKLQDALFSGKAYGKFLEFVKNQGGNTDQVEDPCLLPQASLRMEVYADREGFVTGIHTEEIGRICLLLGGGRAVKEDPIDPAVGIVLHRKIGDFVQKGDSIATICANDKTKCQAAGDRLKAAYEYGDRSLEERKIVYEVIH